VILVRAKSQTHLYFCHAIDRMWIGAEASKYNLTWAAQRRVKLRGTKRESAEQQSPGLQERIYVKPYMGGAVCLRRPYRAFAFFMSNPGFRPLRGLHPGLCCSALSALSLSPM